MSKVILIARREVMARLGDRSFRGILLLGPVLILLGVYIFLINTQNTKKHWDVLIMDKYELLNKRLTTSNPDNMSFYFINAFVNYDQFAKLDKFKQYDLAVTINRKILSNKQVIVSYKTDPPSNIKRELRFFIQRRIQELMVKQFTDLSVADFRSIKETLNFHYKNTYDPKNKVSYTAGWVGFAFGALIILFIFMFGMTTLRSVSKEKSNRIVEVLLSNVRSSQLLTGKVLGIGIVALIQFFVWCIIIGGGLYLFRLTLFPDMFSGAVVAQNLSDVQSHVQMLQQSPFVELIYKQIQYVNILLFFVLFLLGGYLFYGAFFAMIGASMGTESDGQQFIIPINILLVLALLSGYYVIYHSSTLLTTWLSFIPFTSPMVMMVHLSNGFSSSSSWKLFVALFILLLSALLMLRVAGRIYKNGILHFNHRLRLNMLFRWIRR